MALISWGDEDEENKDDLGFTPIKQIASVQSGAWQPAPSGADSPQMLGEDEEQKPQPGIFDQQGQQENYLLSDEKAQVDAEKQQRDAEVAEARRQDAIRAAAAAEMQQQQQQEEEPEYDLNAAEKDTGWKRYYDKEFKREKDGLDFWGRLMDGGQAAKRAEVMARNKYNNELLMQAYDDNGNVLDANAAAKAKVLSRYNSAVANQNSERSRALGNAIGAFDKPGQDGGFWGRVKNAVNAEKQMSIYDAIFGADDTTKFSINDVGRFGGGLVQGIATMPVIGGKEITESVRGRGTNYETGLEEDLNGLERGGRLVSGGLNVVTPFVGGSGKLLDSLTSKVLKDTATAAEKTLLKKLTSQVVMPSLEQGAIGATQAGAEYFGNGNTLLDENGEFDKDKLLQFAKETGTAGAMGVAGGAVLSGGAMGVTRFRNRGDVTPVTRAELADMETRNTNSGEAQLSQNRQINDQPDLQALENAPAPQERVADGVVTPDAPIDTVQAEAAPAQDGNVDFVPADAVPVDGAPIAEGTPNAADMPSVAEGEVSTMPAEVTPVREPVVEAPVDATPVATPETPLPADVTPLPDGTAQVEARRGGEETMTPVAADEVRALRESRAGKNQGEEALINQELAQLDNVTPAFQRRVPKTVGAADAQFKLTGETNLPDAVFSADSRVDPMSGTDAADTPAFYRKNADKKIPELASQIADLDKRIEMIRGASDQVIAFQDKQRIAQAYKVSRAVGDRMRAYVESKNKGGSANRESMLKDALMERNELAREMGKYQSAKSAGLPELTPEFTPVRDAASAPVETPVAVDVTPVKTDSLPDGMGDVTPVGTAADGAPLTRQQVSERLMPKISDAKDVKQRIAEAAGMGKDVESPIRDILSEGNVKGKIAERVATRFEKLEKQIQEYNGLQEANQKAYTEGGVDALDANVSRDRSRAAREAGITTRRLMQDIQRMEGSKGMKARLMKNVTDIIGTRNASVLSSAGLLERNMMQELTANLKLAAKNPIKMTKSAFTNGNILKDTAKAELSHWGDLPSKNPVEIVKYIVGNTYRTGMIPTTALANTRRGAIREELTRWAYKELEGRELSGKDAKKLAGTAGNEMEALVNTGTGIDNGMTNRGQADEALKAWKEYIRSGDDGAKAEFMKTVEQHNSLADQMINGLSEKDQLRYRGLKAMGNLIFPFVRTATNLAKNTVKQDLNPFAKSFLDEIRADQRSGGANAINLMKSKLVDYGIMSGAAALASSGAIVYNDGDEVDKPRGWSLSIGDNQYIPVRATSLELPIAMAGAAQQMYQDISEGKARDWKHYAGMITGSLPYIDQFNTTTGAVDSAMNGEDAGYAARAYGVNLAKSLVPFSNNGIQPYVAGKSGESLNAKSVYDDNLMTWFENTVRKSYDPDFYNSLKDSRDNAGRVRTVDNQGVISNKTINDSGTKEFNQRITDLVNFGRENGLGEKVQDMFNTYDTGKNNNFKSVQDAITFLDVEDGGSPDPAKKLEKNAKLTDLAAQMRDGFFGETGSELLTLDGENIKSDASLPNGAGTKNSKLPLSMQSIKNAVAQTDLPKEDSDKLYDISNQSSELYNQLKAKSITYDQYSAAKAKLGQQEIDILSNSESYQKMEALFDQLDESGFFDADGLGSTKSGQTYLWNSLNALLGSKGATPAANYPDTGKGFTPWGNRGTGRSSNAGAKNEGMEGLRWSPVGKRQMAAVQSGRYTPVNTKVKLGNAIKKDRSQNYSDRSF